MDALALALGTGWLAGVAHVYLGADHLAALMPLAHGRRLRATWLGVRWGLGHSVGVVLVAIAFLVVRESLGASIDFDAVGAWGERLVGVLLLAIGVQGLRGAVRDRVHVHEHEHDGARHAHLHVHRGPDAHAVHDGETPHAESPFHAHTAVAAGTLHGLAGTSHLWGVLPSLALPWHGAVAYLLGFGVGSLLAMGAFAGLFGVVTARLGDRAPGFVTGSRVVASGACVLVGIAWLVLPAAGIALP